MAIIGRTKLKSHYHVECYGPTGNKKWEEHGDNIVVNTGLDHSLSIITVTTHVTGWSVGLTATAAVFAAGDTMLSHAGWTEVTNYTPTRRPAYTPGAISAQSVDNSAAKAAFTMTAATTIGGAFMTSKVTKAGTSGILYGGATFAARTVAINDVVNVTITCGAEVT